MPSLQLSSYFALRDIGVPVERAAEQSGLGLKEARLWEQDIENGDEEAVALARACARAHEGEQSTEGTMDEEQTTISINGGPERTLEEVREALDVVTSKPATDTGEKLKRFIERAERLDSEIADLNSDKSELFKEMKNDGFDTKTVKRIIKLRKMEPHARQEAEALLSTYMDALGMTPIETAIALAA